ncbi:uncharacterized protein F4822DRAFT_267841 [Hypoxylon trugodes]|uniref:uncharacterized protein n=1 Tax=Hypoxylon trugodes TaxID=326681 RepID=UPI0021A0839F|nr:uncharacterized protein F4822DRAFT_267841 [Hypoxylon trugodes]KAI1389043.1 hypothetical protein F4822DRAFT_267841 [Hypoxylon trugodes]
MLKMGTQRTPCVGQSAEPFGTTGSPTRSDPENDSDRHIPHSGSLSSSLFCVRLFSLMPEHIFFIFVIFHFNSLNFILTPYIKPRHHILFISSFYYIITIPTSTVYHQNKFYQNIPPIDPFPIPYANVPP